MQTTSKALPILTLLHGLNTHYKKNYSFPSQEKLLQLLEKRSTINISRATLNRWLRTIEDSKFLKRRRRIRMDPNQGLIIQSTLYTLCYRGYLLLAKSGFNLWDKVRQMAPTRKRKQGPDPDPDPQLTKEQRRQNLRKLGDLLKNL